MKKICVETCCIGMVQTNVYFLHRQDDARTIVFDPADSGEAIFRLMEQKGLSASAIFLTHGHFDHILGVEGLRQACRQCGTAVPVYACEAEKDVLGDAELNASADYGRSCTVRADHLLKDGEKITVADITLEVLHTPGHTEGSCCYYIDNPLDDGTSQHLLISGDTLFEESIGRTDLPTGSLRALLTSVGEKLMPLPEDTVVFPGHGGQTSIGYEKKYNPYLILP